MCVNQKLMVIETITYKLIEIDKKFKIFKSDMLVVDIGAAPGSWSHMYPKQSIREKLFQLI